MACVSLPIAQVATESLCRCDLGRGPHLLKKLVHVLLQAVGRQCSGALQPCLHLEGIGPEPGNDSGAGLMHNQPSSPHDLLPLSGHKVLCRMEASPVSFPSHLLAHPWGDPKAAVEAEGRAGLRESRVSSHLRGAAESLAASSTKRARSDWKRT